MVFERFSVSSTVATFGPAPAVLRREVRNLRLAALDRISKRSGICWRWTIFTYSKPAHHHHVQPSLHTERIRARCLKSQTSSAPSNSADTCAHPSISVRLYPVLRCSPADSPSQNTNNNPPDPSASSPPYPRAQPSPPTAQPPAPSPWTSLAQASNFPTNPRAHCCKCAARSETRTTPRTA